MKKFTLFLPAILIFFITGHANTPLHEAARTGDHVLLRKLIADEAELEAQDEYQATPLHVAVLHDHVECVTTLLQNSANINAQGISLLTPLHTAAFFDRPDCMRALLAHQPQPDIDAQTIRGETSLYLAVHSGSIDCVQQLLKSGANYKIRTHGNWAPLHKAAKRGHIACSTLLLHYGADVSAQNGSFTPMQIAKHYNNRCCIEILAHAEKLRMTQQLPPFESPEFYIASLFLDDEIDA